MSQTTKNYQTDGGNKWIVGGALEALPDAELIGFGGNPPSPEQGAFVPTLGSSGSQPSVTYTEQSGIYWKFGNLCIASGRIACNISSAGSAGARISGLPFTSANNIPAQNIIFSEQYSGSNYTTTDLAGKIQANTNYVLIGKHGSWAMDWGTGNRCYNFIAIYQISEEI